MIDSRSSSYLEEMLQEYGFRSRLLTLSEQDLPVLAECQLQGEAQLVAITKLISNSDDSGKPQGSRLEVEPCTSQQEQGSKIVDLGQITTIWSPEVSPNDFSSSGDRMPFFSDKVDRILDKLYRARVGRARGSMGRKQLTKKQLPRLVEYAPLEEQASVDTVLRQVLKAGTGFARMVDSEVVRDLLFPSNENQATKQQKIKQQMVASTALANDAKSGGRFKRFGCLPVAHHDGVLTVINGGWVVLDQAVRATSEGRKFAERAGSTTTLADGRIITRLECLAMGGDDQNSWGELQVDVRESLRAMNLPMTPEGAKQALIQVGHWTESSSPTKQRFDPWPKAVLEAADWYCKMNEKRRDYLIRGEVPGDEGRTDLTKLPCICMDASSTTFRDDAIGIRPRAPTGRRVTDASKWEILLHIADVSDLYAPEAHVNREGKPAEYLKTLREAAHSRGTSRYDLPLGPLHLLPPTVLHALALDTNNIDMTNQTPAQLDRGINRCVTLWVYIDEKTGKMLDTGLERTLISKPLALSYKAATALLDGTVTKEDPALEKAKALIAVAERNLCRWSAFQRTKSKAARAKEERLLGRETVDREINGDSRFERTRSHRIVDSALDLYGFAMNGLLFRADAPVPRVAGSGMDRLGRVASAPLRRYIDGVAQRQALAVLCGYGGKPLTRKEAIYESKSATAAINAVSNIKASKSGIGSKGNTLQVLQSLSMYIKDNDGPVPAISTGKGNEVVILGTGATASCQGIQGSIGPGNEILVEVQSIDERSGEVYAVTR
ncbi:unnamed protein product [Cylindrotheca closterium]|uniref:RNB domain-containing protein n=1 Tax=Cylindrotheca closterium TaxID=2856 RepID=A0AAD2CG83_9STRA|nr:unnamed protein product [Cylindrotheca closterium]